MFPTITQNHEAELRLIAFFSVFLFMAVWECLAPRRQQTTSRWLRWPNNLVVVALDTVLVRLAFPVLAVTLATIAEKNGWGVFNITAVPGWLSVAASVLVLDFAIYLQHVIFHSIPMLWRLHRMHHADLEFDVTTGLRFHPLEILLSMAIKLSLILALGPPALAVFVFEVLLNATSMFNHGNVRIPQWADRLLRWVIVTPDMHRVHHSVVPDETNSNFGFNLSCWDRMLGTYRAQPKQEHETMTLGIDQFRTSRDLWLDRMLIQPFHGQADDYPVNRSKPRT